MNVGTWIRALGVLLCAGWLTACDNSPRLQVSSHQVEFENEPGQDVRPEEQSLQATILGRPEAPLFVSLQSSQNGLEAVTHHFEPNAKSFAIDLRPRLPTQVGVQTVRDEVLLSVCEDEACTRHIEGSPARVDVSYRVRDGISVSQEYVLLTRVAGNSNSGLAPYFIKARSLVSFNLNIRTDVDWVRFDKTRIYSDQGTYWDVSLSLVDAQASRLPVGAYRATLTLSDEQGLIEDRVVLVDLRVVPPSLYADRETVEFGDTDGWDLEERLVQFASNAASPWVSSLTATVEPASESRWLSFQLLNGGGLPQFADMAFRVNPRGLPPGQYTAQATFTAVSGGVSMSKTIPVRLTLAPHGPRLADNGVALVHTPAVSQLTRTVEVTDLSGQQSPPWSASSNQSWLSLSESAQTLTMTANPAGLAADTLHLATVTVRARDDAQKTDTLQVGLWVGSQASAAPQTIAGQYQGLQMDPIRPYAYVQSLDRVDVYHLYTGSRLASIPASSATSRNAMALGSDGATLFILGPDNTVTPVDLATRVAGTPHQAYPMKGHGSRLDAVYFLRLNGRPIVYVSHAGYFDALTWAPLQLNDYFDYRQSLLLPWGDRPAVPSADGSVFCLGDQYVSQPRSRLDCLSMRFQPRPKESVRLGELKIQVEQTGNVALTQDGRRVYVGLAASGIGAYSAADLSALPVRGAGLRVEHVAVDLEDRLLGVGRASVGSPRQLWRFSPEGALQGQAPVDTVADADTLLDLKVSSDGQRLGLLTSSGLVFLSPP